jgi:hypothetical protein
MEGPQGRSIGSEAATACRRPMSRPSGTRHPNGMARARGRRSAEGGAAFLKKFLCIFWETDSENFVCRISVSPPVPPQIGAHPPPPLRGPLPGFCGERRARRGTGRGAERGACGAARIAQASALPRYAAPSPDFAAPSPVRGRRTDARSALPDGPRAVRGARCADAGGERATPPPCPLPGFRGERRSRRGTGRSARGRGARAGNGRDARSAAQPHPRYAAPSRISRRARRGRRTDARSAEPGGPRATPPPCPLPGFCGERRARGGARAANGRAGRAPHGTPPPLRCPLPGARARRGLRTAARSAKPGGPHPAPATLPPPRRAGEHEVGFRYADRIWGSGLRQWGMRGNRAV